MTPLDPTVQRARRIRQMVLELLFAAFRGNPDVAVPLDQILHGFSNFRTGYTPQEIEAELIDMLDDGLVEQAPLDLGEPLPPKYYRATSAGRDFKRANFPWDRIDEYSGRQKPDTPHASF